MVRDNESLQEYLLRRSHLYRLNRMDYEYIFNQIETKRKLAQSFRDMLDHISQRIKNMGFQK
jgi:hypothetical protein